MKIPVFRAASGILLLIYCGFLSDSKMLHDSKLFHSRAWGHDDISLYEARFAGLKKILPAERDRFCYVPDNVSYLDIRIAEFYLAEYALVPRVLVLGRNCKYVIRNVPEPAGSSTDNLNQQGYVLIKDFGNGVALFRNERH